MILTTDIHLDDNPNNEYRWEVFNALASSCKHGEQVTILGDLVDQKDRHSGELVNRLIESLLEVAAHAMCEVFIIRGNHDTPISGRPYFSFMSDIHNIHYISHPQQRDDAYYLPYSPDPARDWRGLDFREVKCVFMHQTVAGADFGGWRAENDKLPMFPRGLKVYSGDVHVPQTIAGITYVGAPHPKNFGDTHPCRILRIDDRTFKITEEIMLRPMRKHMVDVSSVEALEQLQVSAGDQVRVRFAIEREQAADWPAREAAIREWAEAAGVVLAAAEPIVPVDPERPVSMPGVESDPVDVFAAFCEAENVDGILQDAGAAILEAALAGERR